MMRRYRAKYSATEKAVLNYHIKSSQERFRDNQGRYMFGCHCRRISMTPSGLRLKKLLRIKTGRGESYETKNRRK